MDRITNLIPAPRRVTLAGRSFRVREARLCDLARLQAWVDDRLGVTDSALATAAAAPEGPARDRLLFDAFARLAGGGGGDSYDSPAGSALLATPEGVAFFFRLALGRCRPRPKPADLAVAAGADPAEFAALRRAFFGADARGTILALLGKPPTRAAGPKPVTWGELVDRVARERGWTYQQVYRLTMGEFLNALRDGKPEAAGITGPPEWLESLNARRLAAYAPGPEA